MVCVSSVQRLLSNLRKIGLMNQPPGRQWPVAAEVRMIEEEIWRSNQHQDNYMEMLFSVHFLHSKLDRLSASTCQFVIFLCTGLGHYAVVKISK